MERALGGFTGLARANTKSRLRMVALYALANMHDFMVVGTSNLDEMTIGYFTKFGDGGCDCEPLAELTKDEVRSCAKALGVPQPIIDKAPSAGLWEGQTDEAEMGFTYEQLDAFCLDIEGFEQKDPSTYQKIMKRVSASEHKRTMPPAPAFLALWGLK
jgi:NAD+ synthase